MIGSEVLLTLLHDAVQGSAADQTEIVAEHVGQGISRYTGSRIHQTSVVEGTRIWVRAAIGQAVGTAEGNNLDRDDLRQLVEVAISVARRQSPNPQFVSFAAPESVSPVPGYDADTAAMGSEQRAAAIRLMIERVAERHWTLSGTYLTEGRELAVVNSLGVTAYAPSSRAFLRALPDSGLGTGYAGGWSYRAADIDPDDIVRRGMERCSLNVDQREIVPGEYEAILDDLCVAETLLYLSRHGFNGQAYEEGTSFLSGRLGEQVTGQFVTIWDDGTDARSYAVAADYEGVPKRRISLLEDGVAQGVTYDSYTAHRAGQQSSGNAPHPDYRGYDGPTPENIFMAGGSASMEEMIRSVQRGLLLTRFHYTHCPDPRRVVMTGTTRDGTFLIEDGEIVAAVKNLRLTQSVPQLFDGIELLGEARLCQDWWSSNGMGRLSFVCPPIKVARAVFSSGTLF